MCLQYYIQCFFKFKEGVQVRREGQGTGSTNGSEVFIKIEI